jgi:monofunctional glycosyltransferase
VPLDELPEVLVRAVLVAEDDRFREHGGVDWEALAEEARYGGPLPPRPWVAEDRAALMDAVRHVRENRDAVRGRSTLTQQLARNLYLSEDRSLIRKGQEFILARRLEFFLPKDRILELYLNVVEFGPGIFGVEAASQAYFDRSAREVTAYQAASLAGTLPHPLTSNPATSPGRMAWRRERILARLGGGPPVPPAPPDIQPVELPDSLPAGAPPLPVDSLQADSIPPDSAVRPDSVRPDSVRPDSVRPDSVRPDSVLPDSVPPDVRGAAPPPASVPREG